NLSNLMQRPAALQERVFTRLFEQAEISKFDKQELKLYEDSVNAYRDIVNAIRTAEKKKYAEGRAEGREEGRAEGEKKAKERIASNLLALGVPIETIMQASGLSEEEIKNIQ
ncbi:PD-(D/E)XK nuclease family transposase, partial [uncultured Prevotella sp.]|uniref:PD-(D/E)XK nuclease family transposase n=1 Tax=uncultured Prevotella sp. TaxID=159272 RepID=UPI0027DD0CAA